MNDTTIKTRSIVHSQDTKGKNPFPVLHHFILRNGWEYYLGPEDEFGYAYGYVMGFANEWGSVSIAEIKPYVASHVTGDRLQDIMAPVDYYWEDEKN